MENIKKERSSKPFDLEHMINLLDGGKEYTNYKVNDFSFYQFIKCNH